MMSLQIQIISWLPPIIFEQVVSMVSPVMASLI